MKPVSRDELLSLGAYERIREPFRRRIIELKRARRVELGPNMSALFENHDTALFQIQEMLRTERISAEPAILHELETYNALVPGDSELSVTVFIEYTEHAERERMLAALAGVEDGFYIAIDGVRSAGVGPARGERTDRTTAVHYLKFPLSAEQRAALGREGVRITLGVQHPAYTAESELGKATSASLRADYA